MSGHPAHATGPTAADQRLQLARLCREYMLAAQFNSRTGYAALRINHGDAAYKDTAIQNWMGASPVYTRRMQRALGFHAGADVATIFKGLQLDCGFTHQYFDVHYAVESPERGRFWLNRCGALLEAEPRGEEAVRTMCHDIEDPTFDATAMATNPRARMRPLHRPPRTPADREPHCEWQVFIDPDAAPLSEPRMAERMAATELAALAIATPEVSDAGGMDDYRGEVHEQLSLEAFSENALHVIFAELGVQIHLLINSLLMVVEETYGAAAASAVAEFQMSGTGWVMSERLRALVAPEASGIDAVIAVLRVHPALQPQAYVNATISRVDDHTARLELGDCAAQRETHDCSWYALLQRGVDTGLQALLQGVDRRAQARRVDGAALAWDIVLAEPAESAATEEEPLAVQVAKGTVLYQTQLADNLQVLQLE